MSFPTIVYKCPGHHQAHGTTYDYLAVEDETAMKAAIADGWFKTLPDAIDGKSSFEESEHEAPTREELEAKAAELGVKFDGRTTDALLLSRINEALEGE